MRRPTSKRFSLGFLVVAPGITIRDRLRVLLPNDPDSYYASRELWKHIGMKMPQKGRGKNSTLDPLSIPVELLTALQALYGHYEKTYVLWKASGIKAPPCFIVVCNNTATSKLVYDYISGFIRENEDGSSNVVNGRLELFRNFDEHDNPLPRPSSTRWLRPSSTAQQWSRAHESTCLRHTSVPCRGGHTNGRGRAPGTIVGACNRGTRPAPIGQANANCSKSDHFYTHAA